MIIYKIISYSFFCWFTQNHQKHAPKSYYKRDELVHYYFGVLSLHYFRPHAHESEVYEVPSDVHLNSYRNHCGHLAAHP